MVNQGHRLFRDRDEQYRDTCIGDTYRAILLYRYRYRLSVSLQYRVSVSIKHVFVHRRYKYCDTVFEQDQSYQVLNACSFTVSEECEMKLNSLIDSKRRSSSSSVFYFCTVKIN